MPDAPLGLPLISHHRPPVCQYDFEEGAATRERHVVPRWVRPGVGYYKHH
jgi:hypothetical protein